MGTRAPAWLTAVLEGEGLDPEVYAAYILPTLPAHVAGSPPSNNTSTMPMGNAVTPPADMDLGAALASFSADEKELYLQLHELVCGLLEDEERAERLSGRILVALRANTSPPQPVHHNPSQAQSWHASQSGGHGIHPQHQHQHQHQLQQQSHQSSGPPRANDDEQLRRVARLSISATAFVPGGGSATTERSITPGYLGTGTSPGYGPATGITGIAGAGTGTHFPYPGFPGSRALERDTSDLSGAADEGYGHFGDSDFNMAAMYNLSLAGDEHFENQDGHNAYVGTDLDNFDEQGIMIGEFDYEFHDSSFAAQKMADEILPALAACSDASIQGLLHLPDAEFGNALLCLLGRDNSKGSDAPDPNLASLSDAEKFKKTPCKYFMQGTCYRADCWYSHDLSKIPCTFFEQGVCVKDTTCPFFHDHRLILPQLVPWIREFVSSGALEDWQDIDPESRDELVMDLEEFPELSASSTSSSATLPSQSAVQSAPMNVGLPSLSKPQRSVAGTRPNGLAQGSPQSPAIESWPTLQTSASAPSLPLKSSQSRRPHAYDLSSRLKLNDIMGMFPDLWPEDVEDAFVSNSCNLEHTVAILRGKFPHTTFVERLKSGLHVASASSLAGSAPSLSSSSSSQSGKSRKARKKVTAVPVDWVTTGSEMQHTYEEFREEGLTCARARARMYQEATQAYLRGDRESAKRLSRRAQEQGRKMQEAHKQAAEAIFATRNFSSQREDVLDLHGLHVQEALTYLEVFLNHLSESSSHKACYVITGTGHHSDHKHLRDAKKARLLPAVRSYLEDQGLAFEDASRDRRGGMLRVSLG